jgi:hypothetical protein
VSNQSVTDEIILEGFRNLAEAMANGFDRVDRQLAELRAEMNARFAQVDRRFAEFESRMMRRFDEVGARLDDHERRITALETQG